MDSFHERAQASLTLLFIHQSKIIVDRIISGISDQTSSLGLSEQQESIVTDTLLKLIGYPDENIRLLWYKNYFEILQ